MKKLFALLLAFAILFSFAGCKNDEASIKISDKFEKAKDIEGFEYKAGTIDGGLYTSANGISFEKPENWVYAEEEEIKNIGVQDGVYYDMICYNEETASEVSIVYEDLLKVMGNVTVTESQYMEGLSQNLYNAGYMIMEQSSAEFGGKAFTYITAYAETEEVSLTQTFYIRKEGNSVMKIVISVFNDESMSDITKCFK